MPDSIYLCWLLVVLHAEQLVELGYFLSMVNGVKISKIITGHISVVKAKQMNGGRGCYETFL